jgi:HD-like signal output (HDOD) protein/CheY-like chemotaxis protein
MKKRVLFVDDQANVLSGLRRTMRAFADEWEMEFVTGGAEAVARFESEPYDVIVSDMCMPIMDGAALLDEIRRRWPDTVRIILSGQANEESIRRSIGPTHQYLSKPCDPEVMRATVTRACALRDRLSSDSMRRLTSQITTIPSLPKTYSDLVDEVNKSEPSLTRVAELISHDVGMTAKLLQLTNSSFFGVSRRVKDAEHAVGLLGLNVLKPLVIAAGVFTQFEREPPAGYSFEQTTEHSMRVGVTARGLAATFSDDERFQDEALMAGVLHDVGQLILAANLRDEYARTLQLAREKRIPLYVAEVEQFGVSHGDVGGYLLGLWGLSPEIVEAVTFHHEPSRCPEPRFGLLTAVHVANGLNNRTESGRGIAVAGFDMEYLARLGVSDPVERWRDVVENDCLQGAES